MPGLATKIKPKSKQREPTIQRAGIRVSKPGDRLEQEAEQVARQVTSNEGPADISSVHSPSEEIQLQCAGCRTVSRVCEACEASDKTLGSAEPDSEPIAISRMSDADVDAQTQASDSTPQVTPQLANRIRNMEGKGEPLTPELRSYFEPRFGADFSNVRIHTDSEAEQTNEELDVIAFTMGRNISFSQGRYSTDTHEGKQLLAHELVHVSQQKTLGSHPPILQRKPDPSTSSFKIKSKTPVQAGSHSELLTMLQLPEGTVPPGAFDDPEVLAYLVSRIQGASGSLIIPATGISEDFLEQLPEGQVVEMDFDVLKSEPDLAADLRSAVRGASRGAGARLMRQGFNPNVKNAIGLVAYPQSRTMSALTGAMRGKGPAGALRPAPVLPTTSIVLGHTAVYAKVDGKIVSVRSYATKSTFEALLHFKGISSGTKGVQAAIIDHLKPLPKGGGMFDVAGARSMEYPVSAQIAKEFSKSLPEGGPLPSKYTAAPDVAASKPGNVRLCHGVNCVHWAVDQLEEFIEAKVASSAQPNVSLRDIGGKDAARQGKVMGFMTDADGKSVRMPGESTPTRPVFGRPGRGMRLLRWGGRVFLVYDIGVGVYNVWTAPPEQKIPVALREGSRIGGGVIGAELGVAGCIAFGIATEGLGLLVCGLVGAVGGAKAGEAVGQVMGNLVMAPLIAADTMAFMLQVMGETAITAGKLVRAPFEWLARAVISMHASLNPNNWDVRYLPEAVRIDLLNVGYDIWDSLYNLNMDDFLERIGETLETYPISGKKLARLVEGLNASTDENFTVEQIIKMKPYEFIEFWKTRKLHFILRPDYIAGLEERDTSRFGIFRVHRLVAQRAAINPENWEVSKLPAIEGEGYAPFLLGDELISLGRIWWSHLGNLPEEDFRNQVDLPLSNYRIPSDLLGRLAYGIQSVARVRYSGTLFEAFTLEPNEFLKMTADMTPNDFVRFVLDHGVDLEYVRDPYDIGLAATQWVSQGYQPW
ncbi:hypothetical protein D3OALGA1CA_4397 [Olavius algarvensis associated proteobacterium Delta 3]|nr:hypothetical protein D3OALGA1CA_4397 [Olavius algarvensis associated proteobacterium Delta 3]